MCASQWYTNSENYNNKIIVSYLYKIIGEEDSELISIESIESLCIHINVENAPYIARPSNTNEYNE